MNPPFQSLSLGARLSTSPRLLQTVQMLQMSALEFEQELSCQLALNPFLEEIEADAADTEAEAEAGDEVGTALFDHADLDPRTISEAPAEALPADDHDWPEPAPIPDPSKTAGGLEPDRGEAWDWLSAPKGLREHLHEQVDGARLGEREQLAARLVIETLDDDGYLRDAVADSAEALQLEPPIGDAEIAAGIAIVQQFDPPGVAARDLAECLGLQLQALPASTPGLALARQLAGLHLELLGLRDYATLRHRLDCSEPSLLRAHALIRRLDPRPGLRYSAARIDYVVPDVLVIARGDQLLTMTNPAVLPRARLNQDCVKLLRSCTGERHPAMVGQLREASWLLRSAEQRHQTILRVASAIVARQRMFFRYGEVALKPLILREVADELGLHESTLSRATSNKSMATPRGIFEFRHFFSRQLGTDTGGSCSAAAVRALITEMIDCEDRAEPLSDVVLARRLGDRGIRVARRTVTKYRNQLKLPPGELRYLP